MIMWLFKIFIWVFAILVAFFFPYLKYDFVRTIYVSIFSFSVAFILSYLRTTRGERNQEKFFHYLYSAVFKFDRNAFFHFFSFFGGVVIFLVVRYDFTQWDILQYL